MDWERTTFDADGLTGERLNLRLEGTVVGTVVVWPGRATRVYWRGGRTDDYRGPDSRGKAVRAVEAHAADLAEAADRRPLLAKINDRRATA